MMWPALLRLPAFFLLIFLCACKPPEPVSVVAIVGAVLIDGTGGPPISNSVVVIAGTRIVSAGARTNVLIPQGAEEINGSGKFLVPGLIDVYVGAHTPPAGGFRAQGI